jgi:general secretion pathway protein M
VIERAGGLAGRLLALLILFGVVAVAGAFTLVPLWQLNQRLDARMAETQQNLAIQRRIARASAGLQPIMEQLERADVADTRYLKSSSEALAGAQLQDTVKKAIVSKGGSILSTQIVSAEQDGRFRRVVLRVKMRAALEQTVEIFFALETSATYLFLDNVSLTSRSNLRRSPTPEAVTPVPLEVEFDLSGYLRGDGP